MSDLIANRVLIVVQTASARDYLRPLLLSWGWTPFFFADVSLCLENIAFFEPKAILAACLPYHQVARLTHACQIRETWPPLLIISDEPLVADFIRTNGFPATQGISSEDVSSTLRDLLEQLKSRPRCVEWSATPPPVIVAESAEMLRIKQMIPDLSRSGENLLICGEAGTGRNLLMRAIHAFSEPNGSPWDAPADRSDLAFCHFAPKMLSEQEIGAQLEAKLRILKKCILQQPGRGTLFLYEIGSLPLSAQSKLLVLFDEVAGNKPTSWDIAHSPKVRIIAACDDHLDEMVAAGDFRKDLYYRLKVMTVELPPLRLRKTDIGLLTDFFSDKYSLPAGGGPKSLSTETENIFQRYHWPGNVGELEMMVKSLVGFEETCLDETPAVIEAHTEHTHSDDPLSRKDRSMMREPFIRECEIRDFIRNSDRLTLKHIRQEFLARAEKEIIRRVLESSRWNRKVAAERLDISYKSLLNLIKRYHLDVNQSPR